MSIAVVRHRGWIITVRIRKIDRKHGFPEYDAIAILEKFADAENDDMAEREKNLRRIFGAKKACTTEAEARQIAIDSAKKAIDLLY
jgi:hypothetical protein